MAGLIKALFGGRDRPPDPDPLPGLGGYRLPRSPSGETGFPGSTSQTRTFATRNPRAAKINADTNSGANNALGTTQVVRQASYRGDIHVADQNRTVASVNPRVTSWTSQPRTRIREIMQGNSPAEFFGGPMLKTGPGNDTAGANPGRRSQAAGGHDNLDTTTLWAKAQPLIGEGTPGSNNVRNEVAQRYKNAPGQGHTYKSAARADQAGVVPGGQAADGNVKIDRASTDVTVQNRFQFAGTGSQSWAVLREMPYGGRGDGARGANLNGTRYYATGQTDQFWNAGQGDYGIERVRGAGNKRPVGFTEPAPWSAQFYDTTDDVGTSDSPNASPGQVVNQVYTSPSTGRASNRTGRTG